MFKGKMVIVLVFLLALLIVLPVNAADNSTCDASFENNDCLSSIGEMGSNPAGAGSDVELQSNVEEDSVAVGSDDLNQNNPISASNITYTFVGTNIISDDFTQYAVDFKAGERGGNFYALLVDEHGNALSNKSIKIGFNGVTREVVTNENGWAHLQINQATANNYTFVLMFMGDNIYNAVMKVNTVNIIKKPISISASAKTFKKSAKTKKYTITLKTKKCSSSNGKVYLSAGKKVTLKLNGKTYTAKTAANGKATFSLKITKKGKFKATIKYAGDNTYKSYSKTSYITIK